MEENTFASMENFEALLNENTKLDISLYSNIATIKNECKYSAQDIISDVSRQLKAMQSADVVLANMRPKKLFKSKNSTFLPINMLPKTIQAPQKLNTATFDTQCVSGTQLINIIKDAEAKDDHNGITQEFEIPFCNNSVETDVLNRSKKVFPVIDISLKSPDPNRSAEILLSPQTRSPEYNRTDTIKIYQNPGSFIDDIIDDPCQEPTRSCSPIIDIKRPIKRLHSSSPLIVNLEYFKEFERIAIPLVETTSDFNTAKHLINSQILGRELHLQNRETPKKPQHFNDNKENNLGTKQYKNTDLDNENIDTTSLPKPKMEDTILFSDEEETDCQESIKTNEKDVVDLPLTCVLKTSPDDSLEMDHTMYVAFQTPSNKSIQIKSGSFSKAKDILNDLEPILDRNQPTLEELVALQDEMNLKESGSEFIKERLTRSIEKEAFSDDEDISIEIPLLPSLQIDLNMFETGPIKIRQKRKFEEYDPTSQKEIKHSNRSIKKAKLLYEDFNLMGPDTRLDERTINTPNVDKETHDTFFYENIDSKIYEERKILDPTTSEIHEHAHIDDSIFEEFVNTEMEIDIPVKIYNTLETKVSTNEVNTPNEKKYLSSQTLKTPRNNYSNVEIDNKIIHDICDSKESVVANCDNVFIGFQTASNKVITISEMALAKTKNIFHDIDHMNSVGGDDNVMSKPMDDIDLNTSDLHDADVKELAHSQKLVSCETAGTKVLISEEASARIKNIFCDTEKEGKNLLCAAIWNPPDDYEPPFYGFGSKEDLVKEQAANQRILKKLKHFSELHVARVDCGKKIEFQKPSFQGFQTASNIPVKISEEALSKSKKNFRDINTDYEQTNPKCSGFQIESNKEVIISDKVLVKSKKIIQPIDKGNLEINKFIKKTTHLQFQGYNNANNCEVEISERDVAKNRTTFRNIDKYVSEPKETKKLTPLTVFQGFRTANNKQVIVSEEALTKSKILFQNIDQYMPDLHNINNKLPITNIQKFKTANGKQVATSEEALAESKGLLQGIDNDIVELHHNSKMSIGKFQGFKTANGKQVTTSAKALAKSKKLFQDLDKDVPNFILSISEFQEFKTANNQQVHISETALAKSRKIFHNIDQDISDTEKLHSHMPCTEYKGFHLSGPKFLQTEKALANTKIKVKADNEYLPINIKKPETVLRFQGFNTASNKEVHISASALAKSRQIFQGIASVDENEIVLEKDVETTPFRGFECASNSDSKLQIFIQTLAKSKELYQETNGTDYPKKYGNLDNFESRKTTVFSFTNANNDNIKVSNKALTNSRKKVNDFNCKERERKSMAAECKLKSKDINIEAIIDTQVLNHFDEVHTEDFCETPKNKRSGSPILSCPRAKIKKFEIPYSQKAVHQTDLIKKPVNKTSLPKTSLNFDVNYKKSKEYTLKDLLRLEKTHLGIEIEVDPYILKFTFENLLQFEFHGKRNDFDAQTLKGLKTKFLDSINKKLVPEKWLDNHLRLILWKLLSYEKKFPKCMRNVASAKNVVDQLKYRYDKELYNAERPALRKILEKDDTPMRSLVLCVAGIVVNGISVDSATNTNNLELLLTDGWYCIKAIIDRMLANLVVSGRIKVGTKLATNGAELLNCEQGVSPWELQDTSSIRLKLCGNSTRRARWDARLGYHGNVAILSRLADVRVEGGKVFKLRAFVTRVYPALYVEKFAEGSTVTRSERLEHIHQVKYETEMQAQLEKIYEEVEKEFSDQYQLTTSQTQPQTPRQRERLLHSIQSRVQSEMASRGLDAARNVVPLVKVRLADCGAKAFLSIWKPNDAIRDIVKEGAWVEIMNVVPTALRNSEIQISAGRQSVFNESRHRSDDKSKAYLNTLKRTCYTINDLIKNPAMSTEYNEIDTVGIIFAIDPSTSQFDSKMHQFQNVYMTDADKNIICMNFWGGLKKFGFESVLDTGQVVTCVNLQKRAGNTRKSIPQYRVTEFSYFTKTPKSVRAAEITEELTKIYSGLDKRKFIADCIMKMNNSITRPQMNENITPYRFPNIDVNSSKNRLFIDSPAPDKMEEINLTGLDFESSFRQNDTQGSSPRTLLRKRQVKEKLYRLKMYGEPPALSPIRILNKSKNAGSAYKSPFLNTEVAREKKILPSEKESVIRSCSPVISLNRTYVKKSMNPVKLDFNSKVMDDVDESVDHFAEEFDGSPPLSLE